MTDLGPLHQEPGTLHNLYELPFLKLILFFGNGFKQN